MGSSGEIETSMPNTGSFIFILNNEEESLKDFRLKNAMVLSAFQNEASSSNKTFPKEVGAEKMKSPG